MAKKNIAGRLKVVYAFLLLFGPAFLLIFISTRSCEHKFEELPILGKQVEYSFVDAYGKKHTSKEFRGEIVIVTTLQSTCPENCAVSFFHLNMKLYQHLRENSKKLGNIRMISFVTDGEGNPANDMEHITDMLKDHVEGYDSSIWMLAYGDPASLYNFEKNGKKLRQTGDQYFGGHSYQEYLLLMDRDNNLRMIGDGTSEGTIRRFFEQVALLKKQYDKEAAK